MRDMFRNLEKFALFLLLAALLPLSVGCSPKASAPEDDSASSEPAPPEASITTAVVFGIGDVETSLEMVLILDETTDLTNVRFEEFRTKKKDLAKVDVFVQKPYPEELNLLLQIKSFDNFPGHAVQLRPHVYLDGKDIALEGFIYGSQAVLNRHEFKVNVFEHLEGDPSSILVHAELEIALFVDTDEFEVTLDTPPTEKVQTVLKLSNPVRIDFNP